MNKDEMINTLIQRRNSLKDNVQLNKKEIAKLRGATKQTGFTIIPILVFIDEHGRAKMDIALCRGKKMFDKRQTLKEKEDRREMERAMKV